MTETSRPLAPESFGLQTVTDDDRAQLATRLGADCLVTDPERRLAYGRDETESLLYPPDLVVLPERIEQVQALLRYAHERRLPVTPGAPEPASRAAPCRSAAASSSASSAWTGSARSTAGTCWSSPKRVSGLPRSRRRSRRRTVLPPIRRAATAASWAGISRRTQPGPRTVKYGSTRRWVLGLEAVLADGERIDSGSRTRKDASGYALTQLLVGSEGTLAVITAATLRLIAGRGPP
ncbi:MAG: FAD-binding oxidoreductase [Thermoanaerobaculia bacterium]